MKFKRLIARMLSFLMIFSSLVNLPVIETKAEMQYNLTPISSITYFMTLEGVKDETSLKFEYTTTSSWTNVSKNLELSGDGEYSISTTLSNPTGMRNMGYFTTVSGSAITAKFTKIRVNDSFDLPYVRTLKIGSTTENGLDNIWVEAIIPGTKIAEGDNSYIIRNNDSKTPAFVFYTGEVTTPGGETPGGETPGVETPGGETPGGGTPGGETPGGETPVTVTPMPVSTDNPKLLVRLTEEELAAAGVTGWSAASKAAVYVKITKGDSHSLINGAIQIGRDESGNPLGKSSSKYLVGRENTAGKTGNAIQDNIIGKAGTGIYIFPDINLNKTYSDNTSLPTSALDYITLTIRAMSENTDCELLGVVFNNGKKYPVDFVVPVCESTTLDPVVTEPEPGVTPEKDLLKLTLDYCATMDASKYLEVSWSALQSALVIAQAVYDKEGVTEEECKAARAALEDVKTDMLFVPTSNPGNPQPYRDLPESQLIYEMGAGINLGNTMDGHSGFMPSETVWQPTITTKAYIKALHDAGFNTVRIPVTWGSMIDTKNGYTINENWISRVQDIVDYCISQDMYAIINIHHDGAEQDGWLRVAARDIDTVYEQFEYVWRNIANHFKDYDEHLIFESMNEITCMEGDLKNSPEAIAQDTPIIMNLNQIFVNVVRSTGSNNTRRWLAFKSHYANTGTQSGFTQPFDAAGKLIFAAHVYKASTNVTWTYDEVYQVVDSLKRMAGKWNVPMYLGEYGTRIYTQPDTATGFNDAARAYFSEIVNKACQVAGVVPVVWDQGYNYKDPAAFRGCFSYWDRDNLVPIFKSITDAMMRGTFLPASAANRNYDFRDIVLNPTITELTSILVDREAIHMKVGDTTNLIVTTEPANSNDVLLWSTEDDRVATVYRGMIRAKGIGTTIIRAYSQSGSVTASIHVTVTASDAGVPASEIITDQETYTFMNGKSVQILASLLPVESTDSISYESSNQSIVTVNDHGKLVGIKAGTAYVTLTASSGLTKTVKIVVESKYTNPKLNLALNALYNDSTRKYYGLEVGSPVTITEDGQYTVSFDISQLSDAGKKAGITEINKLTALYIKDYDVTKGIDTTSPITSAKIRYDKVVVNGQELTITNSNFITVASSGVVDTGGPLNGWDGNYVAEAVTSNRSVSFVGIANPTNVSVTFTIEEIQFIKDVVEGEAATGIERLGEKEISLKEVGDATTVKVKLLPENTSSTVYFVSSNKSVVKVNGTAVIVDPSTGEANISITATGKGTATLTAMTENGLEVDFTVKVAVVEPTTAPTATPTPTAEPTATPTPTQGPIPTQEPAATPDPTQGPTPTQEPTATPTPTQGPTPTQEPTATPTPTQSPTVIPSRPAVTPSAEPTTALQPGAAIVDGRELDIEYNVVRENNRITVGVGLQEEQLADILATRSEGDILSLNIPIYSTELVDFIKNSQNEKININLTLPNDMLKDGKIELSEITLDSRLLQAAKEAGSDISISVKGKDGKELYTWTYTSDRWSASTDKLSEVNLAMAVTSVGTNEAIHQLLEQEREANAGLIFNFKHQGELPAPASVRIYVGDQEGIVKGQPIFIYYYNSVSGKLETLPYSSNYMVDEEGYITINLIHCSDYVILPSEADSRLITSLRRQISGLVTRRTLYLDKPILTSSKIRLILPSTLKQVDSFSNEITNMGIGEVTATYRSSDEKVAVVNSDGTITAVGKGTAEITVEVRLYSGKTKLLTYKIRVK